MFNPLMLLADALNAIKTNVWSVFLIGIGCILTLHGHTDVGGSLATGGFAILRTETTTTPDPKLPKDTSTKV